MTLRSKQAGKFENCCRVNADRGLIEQGKAITQFETRASLVVEIEKDRDVVPVGRDAMFTIRVYNGCRTQETGISVVATLPEGLQVLDRLKTVQGKISFPLIPRLAPGEDQEIKFRVRALKQGDQVLQLVAATDRYLGRTTPSRPRKR